MKIRIWMKYATTGSPEYEKMVGSHPPSVSDFRHLKVQHD